MCVCVCTCVHVSFLLQTVWKYEYVVRDITANFIQLIIMVLLEVVWLAITFGLPVPDCPR